MNIFGASFFRTTVFWQHDACCFSTGSGATSLNSNLEGHPLFNVFFTMFGPLWITLKWSIQTKTLHFNSQDDLCNCGVPIAYVPHILDTVQYAVIYKSLEYKTVMENCHKYFYRCVKRSWGNKKAREETIHISIPLLTQYPMALSLHLCT